MSYDLSDYVDVAERIREFSAKYPDGSLQSELTRHEDGWLCKAYAYRSPDDPRPGTGHAFEPVPGKTTFTRDSEAMNAETSAFGRAIVALGFETKKIASANEVRNRQTAPSAPTEPTGGTSSPSTGAPNQGQTPFNAPDGERGANPGGFVIDFGKHNGKTIAQTAEEDKGYVEWLAREAKKPAVREAAAAFLNFEDVPFG